MYPRLHDDLVTGVKNIAQIPSQIIKMWFCQAENFDVIGIDEGQFFPDIAWAEEMANLGKVSRKFVLFKDESNFFGKYRNTEFDALSFRPFSN